MNTSHIQRLFLSDADEPLIIILNMQCQVNCKAIFDKGPSHYIRIDPAGTYVKSGNLRRLHKTSQHNQ